MLSTARITKPPKKGSAPAVQNGTPPIPPLQNGDHLTVAEFERRYEAMPHVKKAELINGVVFMGSPVRMEYHADQHGSVVTWLGFYRAHTPGIQLGDNTSLKLEVGTNQPQPDAALRILPECGGISRTRKGYVIGAVELAVEVAASSVTYDLHEKLDEFERNGILEYLVWRVDEAEIDWFVLKSDKYQRLAQTKDGIFKSKVFPGLWLDPCALIADDLIRMLDVVQQGIASPEHQRFVKKLNYTKK